MTDTFFYLHSLSLSSSCAKQQQRGARGPYSRPRIRVPTCLNQLQGTQRPWLVMGLEGSGDRLLANNSFQFWKQQSVGWGLEKPFALDFKKSKRTNTRSRHLPSSFGPFPYFRGKRGVMPQLWDNVGLGTTTTTKPTKPHTHMKEGKERRAWVLAGTGEWLYPPQHYFSIFFLLN